MLARDIQPGGRYLTRVGGKLCPVRVVGQRAAGLRLTHAGRHKPALFDVVNEDTGRSLTRTAARLRPMPGTPEAEREEARAAGRKPRRSKAWPAGDGWREALDGTGRLRRVHGSGAATVEHVVASIHVGEGHRYVLRKVKNKLGGMWRWRSIPRAYRRAAMRHALWARARDVNQYRYVTGQEPHPSHRMITEAVIAAVFRDRKEGGA